VNLEVISGGRAKGGVGCEPSLHPDANVDPRLGILRQCLVRLYVLGDVVVELLTF
jgi:hypothetical protein